MCFSQTIIVIDNDVTELVEDVNYSLYKNSEEVYKSVTLNDKATTLPDVLFDSIAFSKADYETLGLLRRNIDSVIYLTKRVIHLDEVVINSSKDKEIVLGETNRFVKRGARPLLPELCYGTVFHNDFTNKLKINKVVFYINKVKYRTAYKINFLAPNVLYINEGEEYVEPTEVLYSTEVRYLDPKDKKQVEVALPKGFSLEAGKKIFVWVQLIGYYDTNGKEVVAAEDDRTKIKFQLSNRQDFYSRYWHVTENRLSDYIMNQNRRINYEYPRLFFTAPSKSDVIAPALVIYATKLPE